MAEWREGRVIEEVEELGGRGRKIRWKRRGQLATGILWVEVKVTAKRPKMGSCHRTAPTKENSLVSKVKSTEIEKLALETIEAAFEL